MGRSSKLQGIEPVWTDRQQQVLEFLAAGKTNPEIAAALGITLDGAKWHVREVLTKLGVESREDAAAYWQHHAQNGGEIPGGPRVRSWRRAVGWLALSGTVGLAGTIGLVLAAGALRDPDKDPGRGLVLEIGDDAGESYLLTVSSEDGAELERIPSSGFAWTTSGRFIILQSSREVRVMLPDGSGERILQTAPEGKVIAAVYPSWDGSLIAVVERVEAGGADRVTLVDVESGTIEGGFDRDAAQFDEFLGGFQTVWWHPDNGSITIGSGGVQVEGEYQFRKSVAHIGTGGDVRVVTVDASAMVSPDGERLLHGLPATPGCMGFVATHKLELVELATGVVLNSFETETGGLKTVGWLPLRRPIYLLEADAGCHPSEAGASYWELPENGAPIRQETDPFRQLEASATGPVIEVQCGTFPKARWGVDGWSPQPGGRGGGACGVSRGPSGIEPDPASGVGSLWVQGRRVADLGRFTVLGEVNLGR